MQNASPYLFPPFYIPLHMLILLVLHSFVAKGLRMVRAIIVGTAIIGRLATTDFIVTALALKNIGNVYHGIVNTDVTIENVKLLKKCHVGYKHYEVANQVSNVLRTVKDINENTEKFVDRLEV